MGKGTFPRTLAAALRANRTYMETIAAYFIQGEPFAGDAVRNKRAAERANSQALPSLQRLLAEPSRRQNNSEQGAALTMKPQRRSLAEQRMSVHFQIGFL
jgi:uncharacterized membrane protein YccC